MIAVILAGGSGTRFWPLSRRDRPKQLVRLWGERPMIAETVRRVEGLASADHVRVVCGEALLEATRAALPELGPEAFIAEPCARNTAPAIGLACVHVLAELGDEPVAVLPSDHYVRHADRFRDCLARAEAAARDGYIVTLGIEPTRPETGFGYIRYHADRPVAGGAHEVDGFVEKPDRARAEAYLREGNYLWNAGIFVFTPSTMLAEMARQIPETHAGLMAIRNALGTAEEEAVTRRAFAEMERVSIDYAVMEGCEKVATIPADVGWSDVGHWAALDEVQPVDHAGNVVAADAVLHDVRDSVVYSEGTGRIIALAGVEGLVVVDTADAVLVVPKSRAQDVREIVAALEAGDFADRS